MGVHEQLNTVWREARFHQRAMHAPCWVHVVVCSVTELQNRRRSSGFMCHEVLGLGCMCAIYFWRYKTNNNAMISLYIYIIVPKQSSCISFHTIPTIHIDIIAFMQNTEELKHTTILWPLHNIWCRLQAIVCMHPCIFLNCAGCKDNYQWILPGSSPWVPKRDLPLNGWLLVSDLMDIC